MFFVTNREITRKEGLDKLGDKPHQKGPNELHMFEATKRGRKWNIEQVEGAMLEKMRAEVVRLEKLNRHRVTENPGEKVPSWCVAKILYYKLGSEKKNLIFFVHGFNNTVEEVLNRAHNFSIKYNVEVIPFSWPSNGGGLGGIKGALSYKSDKRDALASAGALDRCLEKISCYLREFNKEFLDQLRIDLDKRENKSEAEMMRLYDRLAKKSCPFTVNLICHSMGNYLFKHLVRSGSYHGSRLIFDNVILAAADTNNKDHQPWVDKIRCRGRIYITINEDDKALKISRVKSGEEQQARLGHYTHDLVSHKAKYIDFTDQSKVGKSHAYFEGKPIDNPKVRRFFNKALNGSRAEVGLYYNPDSNVYRFTGR